jgi:hypothetical protein
MKVSNYTAKQNAASFLVSRLIRLEPPYIASILIATGLA